jgi:uncharacterized phage protein (TIGR01671 family)
VKQRPIKFRFWCNAGKSFIEQYRYNGYVDELFSQEDCFLFPTQYTGCNDYQEKEIWEGDIVEFERNVRYGPDSRQTITRGVVEYSDGGYIVKDISPASPVGTLSFIHLYAFFSTYKFTNVLRVIGNKFENPELVIQA